jgi:YD repeat-containing protein
VFSNHTAGLSLPVPARLTHGDALSARLYYDAFGNRVAKTVNVVTTQYLVEDDKSPTGYLPAFQGWALIQYAKLTVPS